MSDTTPPLDLALRVEELCSRFEAEWQSGKSPSLADFLRTATPAEYPFVLKELVLLDVHYRRKAGQKPNPEDYRDYCTPDVFPWLTLIDSATVQPPPSSPAS